MNPDERESDERLAYRVAWRVSLFVLLLLFIASLIGYRLPWWIAILVSLLAGVWTYFGVRWMIAPRMNTLQSILTGIGKDTSTVLENESLRPRDELNHAIHLAREADQRVADQVQELERMEHYRREFLGNVSHELKTPIFAIRGFAETLLDGALDDKRVRRSFVKKVLRNAHRLGILAEDLASVAQIEMGELSMDLRPLHLPELAGEVIESLETQASERKIALRLSMPVDLPEVIADRHHLSQVLSNLIDNGIKYGREHGQVEVIARKLYDGPIKISIVDDGIGIAPEYIGRLTERFFRVEPSRSSRLGGTGLGLAIVKHILSAHGSQLMIESIPGNGSTFGFTLAITETVT